MRMNESISDTLDPIWKYTHTGVTPPHLAPSRHMPGCLQTGPGERRWGGAVNPLMICVHFQVG